MSVPAPPPLGATWGGASTSFAVYSRTAQAIDLCLFDDDGGERRLPLDRRNGHVWWTRAIDAGPGTRYGYRVDGPGPADPAKLLLDPYAGAVEGEVRWDPALHRHGIDSAPFMPRSVVCSHVYDWSDDRAPSVPWSDTVIYELHVKGYTATHPAVPLADRGTYRGLAHPAVVEHLVSLGVTTVELLPVQQFVHDERLVAAGLRNYWGYNSIGFFAPHNGYAASGQRGQQVVEFKQLVETLHAAGLEVILDVVYNHTAEGGVGGPLLAFRGFDETAYYLLDGHDYADETGCGNTVNADQGAVVRLILDSLRHWVTCYRVDGFRFDLAPVLGREGVPRRFQLGAAIFDAIDADPVLRGTKLIAEPWDLGADGYQVGRFPAGWSEWNDRYRDTARDFWRGRPGVIGDLASALTGTAGVFHAPGRTPQASVNFVACHDGFTLADLVSFERKRNEANLEDNRDGTDDNRSWNCGVEGPTDDPVVRRLRSRQQRNLLATLLLSAGVPMLGAGDEQGRSQQGNNNAYCQDDPLSWIDWESVDVTLRSFVRWLLAFRRDHPVLRRDRWSTGAADERGVVDVAWYTPEGTVMTDADWSQGYARSLAVLLDGRAAGAQRPDGRPTDSVFVVCNAHDGRLLYRIPEDGWPSVWRRVLDTSEPLPAERLRRYAAGERVRVEAHSLVVLTGSAREAAGRSTHSRPVAG